jgi:hypothetical protein
MPCIVRYCPQSLLVSLWKELHHIEAAASAAYSLKSDILLIHLGMARRGECRVRGYYFRSSVIVPD